MSSKLCYSRFEVGGSFWENMIPFFKNSGTGQFMRVHPDANPDFYYLPWVISSRLEIAGGDMSSVSMKTEDRYPGITEYHSIMSVSERVSCVPGRREVWCGSTRLEMTPGRWTTVSRCIVSGDHRDRMKKEVLNEFYSIN